MPLDARTDVFSAGIILHEMLTTEKLFRGDTEFALMEKVRKAEVPPPSNFNRRVTPELDAISLKALARDVADRYQSAAQLAADLDALDRRLPLRSEGAAPVHAPAVPQGVREGGRGGRVLPHCQPRRRAGDGGGGAGAQPVRGAAVAARHAAAAAADPGAGDGDPRRSDPPWTVVQQVHPKTGSLWSRLRDKFSK